MYKREFDKQIMKERAFYERLCFNLGKAHEFRQELFLSLRESREELYNNSINSKISTKDPIPFLKKKIDFLFKLNSYKRGKNFKPINVDNFFRYFAYFIDKCYSRKKFKQIKKPKYINKIKQIKKTRRINRVKQTDKIKLISECNLINNTRQLSKLEVIKKIKQQKKTEIFKKKIYLPTLFPVKNYSKKPFKYIYLEKK